MSAFIVGKAHIDAILNVALRSHYGLTWQGTSGLPQSSDWCKLDHTVADQVGRMLWAENVRSVRYRYSDCEPDGLPGPVPTPDPQAYFLPPFPRRVPTPVEGLSLANCLDYQSCESPDWEETEAYRFLQALKNDLIHRLPGYDTAPWEWSEVA